MKKFLISIDTEGDNLWRYKKGEEITTENSKSLGRFQNLCEEYGFKPTYLTNYEMAKSKDFVEFVKPSLVSGKCEIGMHLHAWNNPPYYELKNVNPEVSASYLIEYPEEIMEKKIELLTQELEQTFEKNITTHRAGRWAMDERYFKLLKKYGYKVDCSVTPKKSWVNCAGMTNGSVGSDYTNSPQTPYLINTEYGDILEIPMTVKKCRKIFIDKGLSLRQKLSRVYHGVNGRTVWLRPDGNNVKELLWFVENIAFDDNFDYVMFMLHSSEFMSGGSPTFPNEESIEKLYLDMEQIFTKASRYFTGCTIGEYGVEKMLEYDKGNK